MNPALVVVILLAVVVGVVVYRRTREWAKVAIAVAGVLVGFVAFAALLHLLGFE